MLPEQDQNLVFDPVKKLVVYHNRNRPYKCKGRFCYPKIKYIK